MIPLHPTCNVTIPFADRLSVILDYAIAAISESPATVTTKAALKNRVEVIRQLGPQFQSFEDLYPGNPLEQVLKQVFPRARDASTRCLAIEQGYQLAQAILADAARPAIHLQTFQALLEGTIKQTLREQSRDWGVDASVIREFADQFARLAPNMATATGSVPFFQSLWDAQKPATPTTVIAPTQVSQGIAAAKLALGATFNNTRFPDAAIAFVLKLLTAAMKAPNLRQDVTNPAFLKQLSDFGFRYAQVYEKFEPGMVRSSTTPTLFEDLFEAPTLTPELVARLNQFFDQDSSAQRVKALEVGDRSLSMLLGLNLSEPFHPDSVLAIMGAYSSLNPTGTAPSFVHTLYTDGSTTGLATARTQFQQFLLNQSPGMAIGNFNLGRNQEVLDMTYAILKGAKPLQKSYSGELALAWQRADILHNWMQVARRYGGLGATTAGLPSTGFLSLLQRAKSPQDFQKAAQEWRSTLQGVSSMAQLDTLAQLQARLMNSVFPVASTTNFSQEAAQQLLGLSGAFAIANPSTANNLFLEAIRAGNTLMSSDQLAAFFNAPYPGRDKTFAIAHFAHNWLQTARQTNAINSVTVAGPGAIPALQDGAFWSEFTLFAKEYAQQISAPATTAEETAPLSQALNFVAQGKINDAAILLNLVLADFPSTQQKIQVVQLWQRLLQAANGLTGTVASDKQNPRFINELLELGTAYGAMNPQPATPNANGQTPSFFLDEFWKQPPGATVNLQRGIDSLHDWFGLLNPLETLQIGRRQLQFHLAGNRPRSAELLKQVLWDGRFLTAHTKVWETASGQHPSKQLEVGELDLPTFIGLTH